jgi:SNF2 family DNA or RNA helicase
VLNTKEWSQRLRSEGEENVSESLISINYAEKEAIIQAAPFHVEQAKSMCELAQKHAQEATDEIDNGVLHPDKWYYMVCDYAQNLEIPHFGKDQHGDT